MPGGQQEGVCCAWGEPLPAAGLDQARTRPGAGRQARGSGYRQAIGPHPGPRRPAGADFEGDNHRALQAAVDYVSTFGGGTDEVLPGTYRMGNAVHLRSGVRLLGCGDGTVLLKNASFATPLVDDTDWYDWTAAVEDPPGFEVGGGLLLRGKNPHHGGTTVTKHTILVMEGNAFDGVAMPIGDLRG